MSVTASGRLHGQRLEGIPVINPGDWWGKAWLVELGGSYMAEYYVVEADSVSDAIDEFADSAHGHLITVEERYYDDYPEDSRHYGPSGQVLDLDYFMIHGLEGSKTPWPCCYHADHLPEGGIVSDAYEHWAPE